MPIAIERLDGALEPLTLPRPLPGEETARTLPAQDFTLGMTKLAKRVEQGDEEAAVELLRRCLPGITDAEIDNLTPAEALWVFAYCARRLGEVTAFLGNAAGAAGAAPTAPTSAPSAPTTSSSTPSPASPAPTGKTGGRSRPNRSSARSSLSIG